MERRAAFLLLALIGAVSAAREATGVRFLPPEQVEYEENVADARASVGDKAFAIAWERGRAMSLEEAVAYALNERAPADLTAERPGDCSDGR